MKNFELPKDHTPGMRVPKGGSSCSSCEYLKDRGKGLCGNKYFIAWHGSDKIPAPVDSYCSDWYEPKKENSEAAEFERFPGKLMVK